MAFGIALSAHKPIVCSFSLAGYCDILGRLGFQIARVVPVASYVANELESIVILLVILRQIGCHLQRRVHS